MKAVIVKSSALRRYDRLDAHFFTEGCRDKLKESLRKEELIIKRKTARCKELKKKIQDGVKYLNKLIDDGDVTPITKHEIPND